MTSQLNREPGCETYRCNKCLQNLPADAFEMRKAYANRAARMTTWCRACKRAHDVLAKRLKRQAQGGKPQLARRERPTSFAVQVIADSSGKWCGNALRFATRKAADVYGHDLAARWTMVQAVRVVETLDPVSETA